MRKNQNCGIIFAEEDKTEAERSKRRNFAEVEEIFAQSIVLCSGSV